MGKLYLGNWVLGNLELGKDSQLLLLQLIYFLLSILSFQLMTASYELVDSYQLLSPRMRD